MKRNVQIVPPETFADLQLGKQAQKAAGFTAIVESMKHVYEEMNLIDGVKALNQMNQKGGFDCAGCAWPDPDEKRSVLGEYCENGVKALAEEATEKRVDAAFFEKHSVEEISTWSDFKIGKSGRITQPFYLAKGKNNYVPISWEDAFAKIGSKLKSLTSKEEAVFYTSGRTSNEAAFLYQLFVRMYGTNNLPDCSNMCHESSGSGLNETLGIGKGSVTLDDFAKAEVVLVIGQNPGTNHPRMLTALEKCKHNGGKIVGINPIKEAGTMGFIDPKNPVAMLKGGTALADLNIQVRINGDVGMLKAVMIKLLEKEKQHPGKVFDNAFIHDKCEGFDAFLEALELQNFEEALEESGAKLEHVLALAEMLANHHKIIICWAMGITQHQNGVENVREIVNLLLLKGSIGKPGAGTCPVRGHSNVQGDRSMGIYEKPSEVFLQALENQFNFSAPRKHGYDVVDSIVAMNQEKVKVFIGMGGNFISATPDSEFTGKAMMNCDLSVQISTKLNRSHVVTGEEAIILPTLGRSEIDLQNSLPQFVSVENSMGVVSKSQGVLKPASEYLKSEVAIVCGIAAKSLENSSLDWKSLSSNYDAIRDLIEVTIPGFADFNTKVLRPEGFYLPNCNRDGKFNTPSRKAQFTVNSLPKWNRKKDEFILMTIRTHDQFNTTIYGMHDRYRGVFNERRVIMMNEEDINIAGFTYQQVVDIESNYANQKRVARNFKIIPYDIAKGCIAAYFPETNVLVPIENVAAKSNTPMSKFIEVKLIPTTYGN